MLVEVLAEDEPQMPFACAQQLVQAFAAGAADPAFGNHGRARCQRRSFDDPDRSSPGCRGSPDRAGRPEPLGSTPTRLTPRAARPKTGMTAMDCTTVISTAGILPYFPIWSLTYVASARW